MVSRKLLTATTSKLTYNDSYQLAKSALGFAKVITDPQLTQDFLTSAKSHLANENLTKVIYNYVSDSNAGTSTMKTNIVAILEHQNKQIDYPVSHIASAIKEPKIQFHPQLGTEKLPVRTLVETPIIENFVTKYSQIKNVTLLGDKITIPGRTKNPNRDAMVYFDNGKIIDIDVKTKAFEDDFTEGNLRQIDVVGNDIIQYPRDYSSLNQQYKIICGVIKDQLTFKRYQLTPQDLTKFEQEITVIDNWLISNKNIMDTYPQVEQAIMNINSLNSFPVNLSINNIYQIKNGELTPDEMAYLNRIMEHVNPDVLSKPSYMRTFLVKSLKDYHDMLKPQTYEIVTPLKKNICICKKFNRNL